MKNINEISSNFDFKKFSENSKKTTKIKKDFSDFLSADITKLADAKKRLLENEQKFIYSELEKLDLEVLTVSIIGRLETMLVYVSQEYLDKYRKFIKSKWDFKKYPEQPEKPFSKEKEDAQKWSESVRVWKEDVKKVKDWNTKFHTLTEYLDSIITIDLYGDVNFNVDTKPYIYFKFFNTDVDEIEVFIQELKTCPTPPVKKIKRVLIEDISGKVPDFVKSAKEVRVYFETEEDASELKNSESYVEGVYEKFVIKNDLMRKDGGEWGLWNERKENLNNPVIGDFSLDELPEPLNLNSGDDEEVDDEDLELDEEDDTEFIGEKASDYYWALQLHSDGIFDIIITPKKYFDKFDNIYDKIIDIENFILKGYKLSYSMEFIFNLQYLKSEKFVTKISEIELVMNKSGFEYSFDMQNFVDKNYKGLDSNIYSNEKDFIDALKKSIKQ